MRSRDLLSLLPLSAAATCLAGPTTFHQAEPVWPKGRAEEKNLFVGFRAVVEAPADRQVCLRLTASTRYRAWVNGRFCGCGPARAGHGYYRIDEWDITPLLTKGRNVVAIEVAGYNANSYYLLDQPSFLQAEVLVGDRVLAATGSKGLGFEATILDERLQKVQRYSFQRPFSEVYRLTKDHGGWRADASAAIKPVACAVQPTKKLLPRGVPYSRYTCRPAAWFVSKGAVECGQEVKKPWMDRSLKDVGPKLGGYPKDELTVIPSLDLQKIATKPGETVDRPLPFDETITLGTNVYAVLDLGVNYSGFIGLTVTCRKPTRLYILFDEILTGEDVDFKRMGCVNIVQLDLPVGETRFETFEPYTMRYLKLITLDADCDVSGVYLREYVNPDVWEAHFAASDDRLNKLFAAGRETFAQNATDIFMDCPSRERAGWLCDSFFTARSAFVLSGDTAVEQNFYQNFLLPDRFEHLPEGMLPMCYPADHYNGVFIPNWALWFVVQLEHYLARSGDVEMVRALEPKVMALFEYFKPFLNDDGLLEQLESWVFIEWSKANRFTQDVNYPTNMLYAGALAAAGRMYDNTALRKQAGAIRRTIREQAGQGEFFVDNAVRKNGKLTVTNNHSEVCQYYAFFFDVASPETHPELWKKLCEQFGPKREQTKAFPKVHEANSFIGNMLRIELLSLAGRCQQVLDESVDFLLYMADRTGTLWENVKPRASCNHGFASHIVYTLYRDVLGVHGIDPVNKQVQLRFADLNPTWCRGRIPLAGGAIDVSWQRDGKKLTYHVDVPAGYELSVETLDGVEAQRLP